MIPTRAVDLNTGKEITAEVLTPPEIREARRRARRKARTQKEQGLRILSASVRQASKGRLDRAGETIMSGFGRLLLDAMARKLRGED